MSSYSNRTFDDFPKTFSLERLKKGYFPHLFNTLQNASYVGPIPDKEYYSYDVMKPGPREEFMKWYNNLKKNFIFDSQKELYKYCNSDVDVLRRGCLELCIQFLEIADIVPFQYLTIASVCMATYRSKYLPEKTIGVFNNEVKDQFSKVALTWLMSFNDSNIQHAVNSGEVKILGEKVDGFDAETNTVYHFQGCFFHGCPDCY